jgi:hypothetical protein
MGTLKLGVCPVICLFRKVEAQGGGSMKIKPGLEKLFVKRGGGIVAAPHSGGGSRRTGSGTVDISMGGTIDNCGVENESSQ